ncbi:MAG TPA: NAD(P)-binding domain-containing protein [Blastocatellia bacterium]
MDPKSSYIISRKDKVSQTDDVRIETQGLTIGRLLGNDLVLNHRSVSRTHAGIKLIGQEYWLFNLSVSNGTLLNGELVTKVPLADGDVIQVGAFVMKINYAMDALKITVEMELDVHPMEGVAPQPRAPGHDASVEGTMIVSIPKVFNEKGQRMIGSSRLIKSGLLTGVLPALDERALNVFWDKRKREAGKILEKTALQPRGNKTVGKAQFNWQPTLDLLLPRRKSFFALGGVLVALFALGGVFLPDAAYSPGTLSKSHTSDAAPTRGIANQSNGGSCSSCHSLTASINSSCTDCHTVKGAIFQPTIYNKHKIENMGCVTCHAEHRGSDVRAGLVAYNICSSCHNGAYTIKAGENAGKLLPVPHGGSVGYPVTDGVWTWKGLSQQEWSRRGLPLAATQPVKDQFHIVHQTGRMQNRMNCTDCHTAGTPDPNRIDNSPRAECAKCHALALGTGGAVRLAADCGTCHQQHNESEDTASLIGGPGQPGYTVENLKAYVASIDAGGTGFQQASPAARNTSGGAGVMRQQQEEVRDLSQFGALPWYGWIGVVLFLPAAGLVVVTVKTRRRKSFFRGLSSSDAASASGTLYSTKSMVMEGPSYPHPVIDPVLCIGCHACVEACPHDVLAIVNGIASPIALDQCMEDTGCQVECPTNPKACTVVNTKKKIPPRKVPGRDARFMTGVKGMYLIGDVSGVPLIKNAVNEGGQVIDYIVRELSGEPAGQESDYDVAVIGIGPAGLSAAAIAQQRGLKVLALEQERVVSTIQAYPAGKYVFFKPDTVEAKGGIPIPGAGESKEKMIQDWLAVVTAQGLQIHEEETCSDIKIDGGIFTVITEKGKAKARAVYSARRVILAIGNRGTPMKLGVPGEDIKLVLPPDPAAATRCVACGGVRKPNQRFCPHCGNQFGKSDLEPREDPKVKYRLMDPDDYKGKKCIVVGAGNSAIEAAVDLSGFKRDGDQISFIRDNEVTLVIRSDFKGDLKLGNKMNVYDCIDAGKIKVYFRTTIKEITNTEVVLMDARGNKETARLANDYIFALIGGEKPTKFLQALGVKILG